MGFLSRLLGRAKPTSQATTLARPFRIDDPAIGFLNLLGDEADDLLAHDSRILSPMFSACDISTHTPPSCQVLFVYAVLDDAGRIVASQSSLRELIKEAGAYIAVVGSENGVESCSKVMETRSDWNANLVLCVDRDGDKFAAYFRDLFSAMFQGKSMLTAWVELSPQSAEGLPDGPTLGMAAQAGHIVFTRTT